MDAAIQPRHSCLVGHLLPGRKGKRNVPCRSALNRGRARSNEEIAIGRFRTDGQQRHQRHLVIHHRILGNRGTKPLGHGQCETLGKVAMPRGKIRERRRHEARALIGNPLGAIDGAVPGCHGLSRVAPTNLLNGSVLHVRGLQLPGHTRPLEQMNGQVQ